MSEPDWMERNRQLKDPGMDPEIPEFDTEKYDYREKTPAPTTRCKEDCQGSCYIDVTDDVSWMCGSHNALIWKHSNISLLDSNTYYVSALIEDVMGNRHYHAELAMGRSKVVAWHIYDIAVTVGARAKILGDTSIVQLGPNSVKVNGMWTGDDLDRIDEIITDNVEL